MKRLLIVSLSLVTLVSCTRDRTCCKYSCGQDGGECPPWCGDVNSCVLRDKTGLLSSRNPECSVSYDSKKNKTDDSIARCLARSYDSDQRLGDGVEVLPFSVVAYPFKSNNQLDSHFTGIDLRYKYGAFQHLEFRIKNTNSKVCPTEDQMTEEKSDIAVFGQKQSPTCHPRCVNIDLSDDAEDGHDDETYLSYDCEAGFYIQVNNWVRSSQHEYELSVCVGQDKNDDRCDTFLFQLPDVAIFTESLQQLSLVLLDVAEYQEEDVLVLWIPYDEEAAEYNIEVLREIDNITEIETVYNVNISSETRSGGMMRLVLHSLSLSSGRYQALVTPISSAGVMDMSRVMQSVRITRPSYRQHALATVTAVLVTVIIVGLVLSVYRQWQLVAEQGAVEPGDLVKAGRMQSQSLLIITPLDNPDHVDIVKQLCRYLKEWCGVGTTYFAFDESTGIGVKQNDPWKWCQETGEAVKESGHLVYIAGPDQSLSNNTSSIFPNLEQNQAFVTTRHLQTMDNDGRVMVVRLGYSNMKTIPKEVPDHLRCSSYNLPRNMNGFLVKLLGVKKKALCRLFPFPLVRPDIRPASLTRPGGPELLTMIQELCLKEAKHRQALQQQGSAPSQEAPIIKKSSAAVLRADPAAAAETAALLSKEIENLNKHQDSVTLKIELEPTLPSVKNMEQRDRLDIET